MNTHKLYIPAVLVLAAVAVFVGWQWLKAHDAWRDAQNEAKLQAAVRAQLQQDTKDLQTHFTATGKDTAQTIKDIKDKAAEPMTEKEFDDFLSDLIPDAKVQKNTTDPGKPPLITFPDTPEVRAEIVQKEADCRIAAVGLSGCASQLADMTKMRDKALATSASWEKESGTWEGAANAHTGFWKGLKHDALKIGIAFGAGFALAHRR